MLSLISKFKNRIRDTFKNRDWIRNRNRNHNSENKIDIIMPLSGDSDGGGGGAAVETEALSENQKSSVLFNYTILESEIKSDFELQELLTTVRRARIELANLILEPRIEEMIEGIPNATPITKVKLRILYIIIALDIYTTLFDEKKEYRSLRTVTRRLGVFHYSDYIIRIDDAPYSFINESDVADALKLAHQATPVVTQKKSTIILPFLIYKNIRRDRNNNICECKLNSSCQCIYMDNASYREGMENLSRDAILFYNKLRQDAISFSIQYYAKNTVTLYNWVKDTMGSYNQFSTIQYPFFIHLFRECAELFRTLHAGGIVHGDVKPDNILIREHDDFSLYHIEKCKNFTVYLIDFGLSGIHGKGYGTGGTIPYCHPEFKNIQDTNRSSKYNWKKLQLKHDVWSLGIGFLTLYIYRDYYNYYYKYPNYFFTKTGYVSSLIIDVITYTKLNELFTKMMSEDCLPIEEVCQLLQNMENLQCC